MEAIRSSGFKRHLKVWASCEKCDRWGTWATAELSFKKNDAYLARIRGFNYNGHVMPAVKHEVPAGQFSQKFYQPSQESVVMIPARYEALDQLDSTPLASVVKREMKGSDVQQGNQLSGRILWLRLATPSRSTTPPRRGMVAGRKQRTHKHGDHRDCSG